MPKDYARARKAREKAERKAALQSPMGEQRYQELMSRLGQAFAQAGPQIREAEADSQAQMRREKEAQRQQWLERRAEAITQIQGWIDHYKLTREDLA